MPLLPSHVAIDVYMCGPPAPSTGRRLVDHSYYHVLEPNATGCFDKHHVAGAQPRDHERLRFVERAQVSALHSSPCARHAAPTSA